MVVTSVVHLPISGPSDIQVWEQQTQTRKTGREAGCCDEAHFRPLCPGCLLTSCPTLAGRSLRQPGEVRAAQPFVYAVLTSRGSQLKGIPEDPLHLEPGCQGHPLWGLFTWKRKGCLSFHTCVLQLPNYSLPRTFPPPRAAGLGGISTLLPNSQMAKPDKWRNYLVAQFIRTLS